MNKDDLNKLTKKLRIELIKSKITHTEIYVNLTPQEIGTLIMMCELFNDNYYTIKGVINGKSRLKI